LDDLVDLPSGLVDLASDRVDLVSLEWAGLASPDLDDLASAGLLVPRAD